MQFRYIRIICIYICKKLFKYWTSSKKEHKSIPSPKLKLDDDVD